MDLVHACLMIVASICFNGHAEIRTRYDGLGSGASITIEGVEIYSMVSTDNVTVADETRTEKKCIGDRCFFYATSCEADATQTECKVWYGLSPCDEQKTIDFKAKDWLGLKNVRSELYFVPFDSARIPFSELTYKPPALVPMTPQESRERRSELYERCKSSTSH